MNEVTAKLKAIRERTNGMMELHANPPNEMFDNMHDQFFTEAEKLKIQFPILADFKHENYSRFLNEEENYFKWATRALIQDIDYYLNFMESLSVFPSDDTDEPKIIDKELEEKHNEEIDRLNRYHVIIKDALEEYSINHPYSLLEYEKGRIEKVLFRMFDGELDFLGQSTEDYFDMYGDE